MANSYKLMIRKLQRYENNPEYVIFLVDVLHRQHSAGHFFPECLGYGIIQCLEKVDWPATICIDSDISVKECTALAQARLNALGAVI